LAPGRAHAAAARLASRPAARTRPAATMGVFGKRVLNAHPEGEAYDYVVVGGGTAGCVLANRLSADPAARVLVLEAGEAKAHKSLMVKVPVGLLKIFKSAADWNYAAGPAGATGSREVYLCRGKMFGGSSCANVMLYNRGAAADYDAWAAECGDRSWSAERLLPFFTKAENNLSRENARESPYHGTGGPISVSDVPYQNPMSKAFLEATAQAGRPKNADFNDWSKPQEGFGRYQVSQKRGRRVEAASTYLDPVRGRSNLDVVAGAMVSKIEFESSTGPEPKATGVTYTDASGVERTAKLAAGGEALLTLGAIGSPQVLMLSGLGPAAHLQEKGIPVVRDLPGVGSNLQDHPAVLVSYNADGIATAKGKSHSSKLKLGNSEKLNPVALAKWIVRGVGPLTSPGCDHGGFAFSSDAARARAPGLPDLQYRFLASKSITPDGMSTIADEYLSSKAAHPDGFTVQTIAARPFTRGEVRLRSNKASDKPAITNLYLEDERDVQTLVDGIKQARHLATQPALAPFRGVEEFPGPAVSSDADLADYCRRTVHSANALVGTCKMGAVTDPTAVVDSELRVRGVTGVRVCDSSVMPKLPGGQTAPSTIAIAEKAAELLAPELTAGAVGAFSPAPAA